MTTTFKEPQIETERLIIRSFVTADGPEVARVSGSDDVARSQRYVDQGIALEQQLIDIEHPPIGDRAVILKESQTMIGLVGLPLIIGPFEQLVLFDAPETSIAPGVNSLEIGLFYHFDPRYRRQRYATEASLALVKFAFEQLNLKQIVATTAYDNHASMGVMRKLGLTLYQNALPEPEWFQVVGILRKEDWR
jgi:RimJ/RimL family protein N-acetyltransferase